MSQRGGKEKYYNENKDRACESLKKVEKWQKSRICFQKISDMLSFVSRKAFFITNCLKQPETSCSVILEGYKYGARYTIYVLEINLNYC